LFNGQGRDEPPHQNTVGTAARRTFKRAGVTGYTLHALRHYFASTLLHSGADVVTVQRAMGHGSAATTLRVYAHWIATAEDRTRQAAADAMAEVFARSPHPVRTQVDQPEP
jgi:integrase